MALGVITDAQRELVAKELGLDEQTLESKAKQVKEWIKKQPHFPQIPDAFAGKLAKSFLIGTKLSTEKSKSKIDTYYTLRHQMPDIFLKRDPLHTDIKGSVDILKYTLLPQLTPEGHRVHVVIFDSIGDQAFTAMDLKALLSRFVSMNDARMLQDDLCCGDCVIYDGRGIKPSHITEMPWSLIHKFLSLIQDGLPLRVKGVYLINAPAYIETILNMVKPVLKEKIKKRIQVVQGDHTQLYKFFPREMLPSNYGGDGPSVEESSRAWQKTIELMRDFLVDDEKRLTDESKRTKDSATNYAQMFGINGTFTKLTID